jgi:hypothetical protein
MRKYISAAAAFLVCAGLGASAQSVWTGPTVGISNISSGAGVTYTSTAASTVYPSSQAVDSHHYISLSSGAIVQWANGEPPPPNALYHQVVDRYYDASGQEVETRSASHVVGYDCHSGRRQQDLIVQDDGKGGAPRFVALLMGNEPTEGQKPVTAEDKVKIILAANKGHTDDGVAPASVPATVALTDVLDVIQRDFDVVAPASPPGSVTLAANR